MNCFRKLCLTISFVALGGCATVPTRNEMLQANYGPERSKTEFENIIRNGSGFFDPYSAMIGCTDPRPGWEQDSFKPLRFGYIAKCSVNAKNRMGGYVGVQTQMYIMSDNLLYPIRLYNNNWGFVEGVNSPVKKVEKKPVKLFDPSKINDLQPGISTIEDAKKLLGEPYSESQLPNLQLFQWIFSADKLLGARSAHFAITFGKNDKMIQLKTKTITR